MIARLLFWDFKRGSWQYDIVVGLILTFVFATPRSIFRDQPKAATIMMLPSDQSTGLFWIAPQVLSAIPAQDLKSKAGSLVNSRFKTHKTVTDVEPILDAEEDITGYMVYTQP